MGGNCASTEVDLELQITGLGSLGSAETGDLSHLSSPGFRPLLSQSSASAVIMTAADVESCPGIALVVTNPYLAYAKATHLFAKNDRITGGVHPSADIASTALIDPSAAIAANVVVGEGSKIGPGVSIGANTTIGPRCDIGADTTLAANVSIYADVEIGQRCQLHSGCVIGASGFGFIPGEAGRLVEISQIGGVSIGNDVSIGACTTVDCGAIENTIIEDGVKIDNQVQIGHNCKIGAHTMICGCVGIAGSTIIGKHCVFAGGAGAGGDKPIVVCDGVMVSARTVLSKSVNKPGTYSGTVIFHEHNKWRRNALRFSALEELFKRVAKLERKD